MKLLTAFVASVFTITFVSAVSAETVSLIDKKKRWLDTEANNSMTVDSSLYDFASPKNPRVLKTVSELVNIHSHYNGPKSRKWKNYTYTGKMRIDDPDGGVGVTVYSKYNRTDKYYRLRRYSGEPTFHFAPHGTTCTSGDVDTGVNPDAGVWYNFEVKAQTFSSRTKVFAKVWREGTSKPGSWMARCIDDSSTRSKKGRAGVWSMANGKKRWGALRVRLP
ncbi:MAG: hypothetical protein KDD53_00940 [Bdellovibrionales bacterium]|nr:hypothetical protein [Bdellovibrionales bacterium]